MPPVSMVDPTPSWLRPENASVLDPAWLRAIRLLAQAIGADNPQSQVMALANPMEVGPSGGLKGALDKVIKAYHGSPHDFERFDTSKIGTGEGAQAYGHGLYFAENPGTAQAYRQALANPAVEVGPTTHQVPKWSPNLPPEDRMIRRLADARANMPEASDAAVVAHVRETLKGEIQHDATRGISLDDPWMKYAAQQLDHLDRMEKQGIRIKPGGKMYEVAIHADPEHFLDWDKPLSQQPEKFKAFAEEAAYQLGKPTSDITAGEAMPVLGNRRAGTFGEQGRTAGAAALSKEMSAAGIPGIKYLDHGSRATSGGELIGIDQTPQGWQAKIRVANRGDAGTMFTTSGPYPTEDAARQWANEKIQGGTRNWVVFDAAKIEILKKLGIAAPVIEFLRQKANSQGGLLAPDDWQKVTGS